MTIWIRGSAIFIALLVVVPTALSAGRPSKPAAREASPDYSRGRVPPRFRGTSMPRLYDRAFATRIGKDEFETDAQFQARVEAIPVDTTLYSVSVPVGGHFKSTYDAELQTLTFAGSSSAVRLYQPLARTLLTEACAIILDSSDIETSTYSAQNAFGATKEINKFRGTFYCLYVGDQTEECAPSLTVTLAADSARIVKQKADRMLVAFRLNRRDLPFVTDVSSSSIEPRMDMPLDIQHRYRILAADIAHIWVINYETGAVLYRMVN